MGPFFKVWLVRPQAVLSSTYVDHLSIFRRSFGLHLISVNFWSDWAAIITLDSSSSGILEEENPRSGRIWGCIVFVCWWSIEEHFSEVVTNEWWWCSMVSSSLQIGYYITSRHWCLWRIGAVWQSSLGSCLVGVVCYCLLYIAGFYLINLHLTFKRWSIVDITVFGNGQNESIFPKRAFKWSSSWYHWTLCWKWAKEYIRSS